VPDACALLSRICKPPFDRKQDTAFVWVDFQHHFTPDQFNSLLSAPESSFLRLEKDCRRRNSENLIGYGMWALAQKASALCLAAFLKTPARLFRTAKTVGCLLPDERLQCVNALAQIPALRVDLDDLDDTAAYTFSCEHGRDLRTKTIPSELRRHYDGISPLSGPRLSHYHKQMRELWLRACLEHLDEMVIDRLACGLSVCEIDDRWRHALKLTRQMEVNRPALRKFLAAYGSGHGDYILTHPLSRQWLSRHPELSIALWTTGIVHSAETARFGRVTIRLEADPLEVLRLGTYAGSCLGLGGILQYSAAAAVLDINKRVVYARDCHGAVVGRQILAYSEDGRLVCFSVYPYHEENDLADHFAEFDRQFSAALGIPIVYTSESGEAEYDIALILAKKWWDDQHWDGPRSPATHRSASQGSFVHDGGPRDPSQAGSGSAVCTTHSNSEMSAPGTSCGNSRRR